MDSSGALQEAYETILSVQHPSIHEAHLGGDLRRRLTDALIETIRAMRAQDAIPNPQRLEELEFATYELQGLRTEALAKIKGHTTQR